MTTGYYCATLPFCGGGKKKTTKKQNRFMTRLPRYPSKKHRILDHVVIKKEYPYNYNENIHKIHLSDREIITIRIKVYKVYKVYKAYKTFVAFKTYKAFMAFKRSRLNPFQKYRSITSFSVDWPRTIRLVYASVGILSVCTIKLQ